MSAFVIAGARIVTPDGIIDNGWVSVDDGRIAAVGAGTPEGQVDVDAAGGWLVPGFVDIHTHGGGNATVVGAVPEAVRTFAATHRRFGTTTIVASLVSASPESLESDIAGLADLTEEGVIAGTHIEGPWIAMEYKGAHDPQQLRAPGPDEVARMIAAGRGTVRMVTLAPELEHGVEAFRAFSEAGVIAAVGHTNATYDQVRAAIDAGATQATHLFNAMRPLNHREPGPIAALMSDERVALELIADGVHVHPAVIALVYQSVPADRIILCTDAMAAAGAKDGRYLLGELEVDVVAGVARLTSNGAIAGSTLTMDVAFRRVITESGFSVEDAVLASATVPARMLNLGDRTGSIAAGLDADLCLLDGDYMLQRVWAKGAEVDRG